jgi:hypothetical protein
MLVAEKSVEILLKNKTKNGSAGAPVPLRTGWVQATVSSSTLYILHRFEALVSPSPEDLCYENSRDEILL